MMSPENASKNPLNETQPAVEEPKSAHATPAVEKYIKKRNVKAEKQIQKEEDDTDPKNT